MLDPTTRTPKEYGAWILGVFKILARLKLLRGTRLDIFGRSANRKMERRLIVEYRQMIENLLPTLSESSYPVAVELANLPEQIRGYDVVKEQHIDAVYKKRELLLKDFGRAVLEVEKGDVASAVPVT